MRPALHIRRIDRFGSRAKKIKADGHTFDSLLEHRRYLDLLLLQRAGEISELEVHPKIWLVGASGNQLLLRSCGYPNGRRMSYTPDFRYLELGVRIVEDVKMQSGYRPESYRYKRSLLEAMGIEIRET